MIFLISDFLLLPSHLQHPLPLPTSMCCSSPLHLPPLILSGFCYSAPWVERHTEPTPHPPPLPQSQLPTRLRRASETLLTPAAPHQPHPCMPRSRRARDKDKDEDRMGWFSAPCCCRGDDVAEPCRDRAALCTISDMIWGFLKRKRPPQTLQICWLQTRNKTLFS